MADSGGHSIPPGVDGQTRGFLVMTVDEILWLRDVSDVDTRYHLRAQWWGSRADNQIVFVPVDVRNFVQNGLIMHTYPVKTGGEKLKQYLTDASPLILSLFMDSSKEAVGRAYVLLDSDSIEGYFPILDNVGEEIAAVHVKILFVDSLKQKEDDRPKSPIKPRAKPNRVTFPVNIVQQSLELPTTDNEATETLETKSTSSVTEVSLCNRSVLKANSLSVTLAQFSLRQDIFGKIKENHRKHRKTTASSKPRVFVYIKISFPGRRDVTFCARLDDLDQVKFSETKMIDDYSIENKDIRALTQSNIELHVGCRIMGCKNSINVGTASLPLRNILFDDVNEKRVSAKIIPDQSFIKLIGLKPSDIINSIGDITLEMLKNQPILDFDAKEVTQDKKNDDLNVTFECPLPPKLPSKKPLYQIPSKCVSTIEVDSPVCVFLDVECKDRNMAAWANIRLKWWTGTQSCGFGHLQCSQAILKPGPEARIYNRQSLSSLLDNYLVLELWKHDTIIGIARVPTHAIHTVAQSWRGHTVTCFDDMVQIVSVTSGNVLGYFNVTVTVGYERNLEDSQSKTLTENATTTVTDEETDVDGLPQDNNDDVDRHYHASDDFLNSISVNEKVDDEGEENNPHAAVVQIEEVRLTSFSSWVYCSFPNGKSSKVFKATETQWNVSVDVDTGAVCSDGSQSHLIIRLWSAGQGYPDFSKDKMRGFVSVDCSPLFLGFPLISGWYNIIDWMGKSKGQMKLTVNLKSRVDKDTPERENLCSIAKTDQMTQTTCFPRTLDNNNTAGYQAASNNFNVVYSESPSISMIENKLTQNLKDLNFMTTKLVADCEDGIFRKEDPQNEQNLNIHPCDLTFGLIDEYLKMTSFVLSTENEGQMTDRSRVGPEGGNAE